MATFNGTEGNDTLIGTVNPDGISGFGGNDFIAGDSGDDTLLGGAGNDTIYGDAGNDWVSGGAGNDSVSGSGGQDDIVFHEFGAANADMVGSFASDWDRIQLDIAAFGNIGANGRFAVGDTRFYAAPGASAGHDADDRVIYNTTTGQLFYDADGNGPGAAELIATLQGAPGLVASDIYVFGAPTPTPTPSTINGTEGDDSLVGTSGNDTINGLGGNDAINGNGGADVLNGGSGNDNIFSGDFFNSSDAGDQLIGGDGDDTLDSTHRLGSLNASTLDGGLGNDAYFIDNGNDILTDSGGNDTVTARDISWTLGSGFENLLLDNQVGEGFRLGVGNDLANSMRVTWGGQLDGLGGNDTLVGSGRPDVLNGGD